MQQQGGLVKGQEQASRLTSTSQAERSHAEMGWSGRSLSHSGVAGMTVQRATEACNYDRCHRVPRRNKFAARGRSYVLTIRSIEALGGNLSYQVSFATALLLELPHTARHPFDHSAR